MRVTEINLNLKNSNQDSASFLDVLAASAYISIAEGYYDIDTLLEASHQDLGQCIRKCSKNAVITEIKFVSPSEGIIKIESDVASIAKAMFRGGVVGLSVLTEPKNFGGSLENFRKIRRTVNLPLIMKDIVISKKQLDAASKIGADVILLIKSLFDIGRCDSTLEETIRYAHSRDLQVLLEVHNKEEFEKAVLTNADLIGINNRNLNTLSVDIYNTRKILESANRGNKVIVSESGIKTAEDIQFLRQAGADAFLIGTSIMKAKNITSKVQELVEA